VIIERCWFFSALILWTKDADDREEEMEGPLMATGDESELSVLLATSNIQKMVQSLAAINVEGMDQEVALLETASATRYQYPYNPSGGEEAPPEDEDPVQTAMEVRNTHSRYIFQPTQLSQIIKFGAFFFFAERIKRDGGECSASAVRWLFQSARHWRNPELCGCEGRCVCVCASTCNRIHGPHQFFAECIPLKL
jgi:hypothetical protein